MRTRLLTVAAAIGFALAFTTTALASKGKKDTPHCVKEGKPFKVKGKNDKLKQAACEKAGGTWAEEKKESTPTETTTTPEGGTSETTPEGTGEE